MKLFKNENGMTLAILLFIITIFTILGLTLVGYIINNTQQFTKTENNIQSSDLAEMGFKNFEAVFNNFYYEELVSVKEGIEDIFNEQQYNQNPITYTETIEEDHIAKPLIENIKDFLRNKFTVVNGDTNQVQKQVNVSNNKNFIIRFNDVANNITCLTCDSATPEDGEKIQLEFVSIGTIDSETVRRLNATISINLGKFSIDRDGDGNPDPPGTGGGTGDDNYGIVVEQPNIEQTCSDPNTIGFSDCIYEEIQVTDQNLKPSFNNRKIIVNNDFIMNHDNNTISEISNSTLYIGGNSEFQLVEKLNDSFIYVGKNATFNKNLNGGIRGSTLVVEEKATFTETVNGIEYVNAFIGGGAEFQHINGGFKHSKFVIKGLTTFSEADNNATISDLVSTSIYIIGDMNFSQRQFSNVSDSKICVTGEVSNLFPNGNYSYVFSPSLGTSDEVFESQCSLINQDGQEVTIDDISFDMEFDLSNIVYEYN